MRSANWWILGLATDPTPGDPHAATVLSGQLSGIADDAGESERGVQALMTDPAIATWTGASGDAFRAACEPFPDQLATLHDSYQDAAAALTAFTATAAEAQAKADGAYQAAHHAAQGVALSDEDFLTVGGFDGPGYPKALTQILLAKQRAAQTTPTPGPPIGTYTPLAANLMAFDPEELHPPYQGVLETMVEARATALAAKDDYETAVTKCVDALDRAGEVPLSGASWDGSNGGTFDQRYSTFGGDPSQLRIIHGNRPAPPDGGQEEPNPVFPGPDPVGPRLIHGNFPEPSGDQEAESDPVQRRLIHGNFPEPIA